MNPRALFWMPPYPRLPLAESRLPIIGFVRMVPSWTDQRPHRRSGGFINGFRGEQTAACEALREDLHNITRRRIGFLMVSSADAAISLTGPSFFEDFNSFQSYTARIATPLTLVTGSSTRYDIPNTGFEGARAGGSDSAGSGLSLVNDDGTGQFFAELAAYGPPISRGSTERALGTIASPATVPAFGAEFINDTGQGSACHT